MASGERPEFTTVVLRCDEPTANGMIYPKALMQRELEKLQPRIKDAKAFGPVGDEGFVELRKVGFIMKAAELVDSNVVLRIQCAPTNAGRQLAGLLEADAVQLGPVGVGTVGADGVVGDDYKLQGFSFGWKDPPGSDPYDTEEGQEK